MSTGLRIMHTDWRCTPDDRNPGTRRVRMGKTRVGFGFDLKPVGFGGDQNPGTRRVRGPGYPHVWHVPPHNISRNPGYSAGLSIRVPVCLAWYTSQLSLETFQIHRKRGAHRYHCSELNTARIFVLLARVSSFQESFHCSRARSVDMFDIL